MSNQIRPVTQTSGLTGLKRRRLSLVTALRYGSLPTSPHPTSRGCCPSTGGGGEAEAARPAAANSCASLSCTLGCVASKPSAQAMALLVVSKP